MGDNGRSLRLDPGRKRAFLLSSISLGTMVERTPQLTLQSWTELQMPTAKQVAAPSFPKLTYKEYALYPADGKRHEIIDGRHYTNAAPNPRHQAISRHIQFQLYVAIEQQQLGEVIDAPIDVQFSDTDVVQPDIVVVLTNNRIITPIKIEGVPDLVIEVLSPSSRKVDVTLKKRLYEQSGVPEFWIVDPKNDVVLQHLRKADGKYAKPSTCHTDVTFQGIPGGVTVDLSKVW